MKENPPLVAGPTRTARLCKTSKILFAVTLTTLLAIPSTWAASITWKNTPAGTQDFNTGTNWNGNAVPGASDNATFTGAAVANSNLSASDTIQGLTFSSTVSAGYTLSSSGTQSLTLTNIGTGATGAITANNTVGVNTINAPIILGGAAATQAAFTQAAGGSLVVGGNISSTNTEGILVNGAGTVTLSGTNSYSGLTTLNLAGSRLILSGNNTATTGGLTVTAGTLDLRSTTALGSGTLTMGGTIVNGSGAALTLANATPILYGGVTTLGSTSNIGGIGNINFGTGTTSYSGVFNTALLGSGATYRFDGTVANTAGNAIIGLLGAGNTMVFGSNFLVSAGSGTSATGSSFVGTGNLNLLGSVQNGVSGTFTGALTWGSTGTLTMSGSNSYSNSTSLNSGVVIFDYTGNAGSKISGSGTGGNLSLGGSVNLNLNGGAVTENVGLLTLNAGADAINRTGGSTGKIVGGGLTRNAGSTLLLSNGGILSTTTIGGGANSLFTTTAGVLGVVGGNDWIARDATTNLVGLSTVSSYTTATGTSITGNSDVGTNVTGTALSASTIRFNTSGSRTIDATGGSLTLTQGGVLVTPAVGNNLTKITGGTLKAGSNNALFVFQNNTSNGLTVDSIIADGSGTSALIKSGAGLMTISNTANTYTGKTYLNQGTLNIAADTSLGAAPGAFVSDQLTMVGGTLQFGASNISFSANRGITLIGGGNAIDTNGFNATISGTISGAGTLTKAGTGTLFLTGVNSFSLPLTVSGGVINAATFANANTTSSIGRGSAMNLASDLILDGGFIQYTGTTAASSNRQYTVSTNGGGFDASGSVSGSLTLSGNMTASGTAGSQTFTLAGTGAGTSAGTISGTISNGAGTNVTSVNKTGSGSWNLSAVNTYTGTTTISAGTLILAAAGTIDNSSVINLGTAGSQGTLDITSKASYTFGSGQTVAGYGSINIGTGKTVTINGNLAPGNSAGVVNVTGNVVLGAASTTTMELADFNLAPGAGFDKLAISGALTYNGTLAIDVTGSTLTGAYDLFDFTTQSGTFSSITFLDAGAAGTFNYTTGVLTLTSVPEPGTTLLLASAGVFLVILRRRSRSLISAKN